MKKRRTSRDANVDCSVRALPPVRGPPQVLSRLQISTQHNGVPRTYDSPCPGLTVQQVTSESLTFSHGFDRTDCHHQHTIRNQLQVDSEEALSLPRRMESGRITRRYVLCGSDGFLESWIHTDQLAITAGAAGAGSLATRA